jgi:Ty3 transposon capsid-like protein
LPPAPTKHPPPDDDEDNTMGTGKLQGVKLPTFKGRDGENILSWIAKIQLLLDAAEVPEQNRVANVAPLLVGDADTWFYWYCSTHPLAIPTWDEFKEALKDKYERSSIRDDMLRQKLRSVKFNGLRQMEEYCAKFKSTEIQLNEMAFKDRLQYFTTNLPANLDLYLRDLKLTTMEDVYQAARE